MNIEIIAEWILYVFLGVAAILAFVGLPIVTILEMREELHAEKRKIEQETIGYREEPIE